MKKIILIFIVYIFSTNLVISQDLGFFGGININTYCTYWSSVGSGYYHDYRPSFGVNLTNFSLRFPSIKMALRVENYSGRIYDSNGARGQVDYLYATISKTNIGLGIYPFHINCGKHFKIGLGTEFGTLIKQTVSGTRIIAGFYTPFTRTELNNNDLKSNSNLFYGISANIEYKFKLNYKWNVGIEYRSYLGLNNEFDNTYVNFKTLRQSLEISIIRIILNENGRIRIVQEKEKKNKKQE